MPAITFQPAGITIEVASGTELLAAAKMAGVEIESPCGAKGTCGKCMVRLVDGNLDTTTTDDSAAFVVPTTGTKQGYIRACKTLVAGSPATIEIPSPTQPPKAQFADLSKDFDRIDSGLLPRVWQHKPLAVRKFLKIPDPKPGDGLSDLDRLLNIVQDEWGDKEVYCSLKAIRKTADVLRAASGRVTVTLVDGTISHLIDIQAGDHTPTKFGLGMDIGTTTVSVQLISLSDGEIVDLATDYNDQITCGVDIISRITYAQSASRLEELQNRILNTINNLIKDLLTKNDIIYSDVFGIAISGNTTMIHLLLGLKPEYIRLAPYVPTIHSPPILKASEVGLEVFPEAPVYISPAIGSYVGGDITAGVFCTDLVADTEEINMFIDIGTNGELVIGNNEFAMACACSAGPAFEGGNIQCGMRAAEGAIEKIGIDPKSGVADYQTIGDKAPVGICGSGMISLLAELFKTGWLDAAGKFNRDSKSTAIEITGRQAVYTIVAENFTVKPGPIQITETEIENIIRAKAAIYAACSLLLEQVGMGFESVSKIYIAGGFGHFLDLKNAITIGLLPDIQRDKFKYIGNASLMGAYMMLISGDFRKRQQELASRITYIDLSTDPNYMDQYTAAMFLPHTDRSLFPSS